MKKKMVLLLLLLPFLGAFAQSGKDQSPWFFVQLSDPQFGMFESNVDFKKESILFEKAVSKINELHPDFVVVTGDFVNDGSSKPQINEFKRILSKIESDIPVYLIPGNHDVGQVPSCRSLTIYRQNYGKDRFCFDHKGSTFIGLNTSLIKGKLKHREHRQHKWLLTHLKKGRDSNHLILFCHYPFFVKTADEPNSYGNIDIEGRMKYLNLFMAQQVEIIFTGHLHDNIQSSFGATSLVSSGAIGKPLGKSTSGMRIVKIYHDKIEHVFYGLDEVPCTVQFDE